MKKMKVISLLIVFAMILCMAAACSNNGSKDSDNSSSPPPATSPNAPVDDKKPEDDKTTENNPAPVEAIAGELGMYDETRDYNANKKFKVEYVLLQTSTIAEGWNRAFAQWATLSNVEYLGLTEFGGDADAFMMSLPSIAGRCDGLILDPDQQMFTRIKEVLADLNTPWMSAMALPLNMEVEPLENGSYPLLNPYAGYNQRYIGEQLATNLVDSAQKLWPDVPLDDYGFIVVDYSVGFALHDRTIGAQTWLEKNHPEFMSDKRFFTADTAIATWDIDTSRDVVTTVLSMNPSIENWLIIGIVESMAQGAAIAVDAFGFTDTTYITAFGAEGARVMWDAGQSSAWRTSGSSAFMVVTEPIFFALYSFMMGEATPDTIWREWVNEAAGETYPSRLVPFFFVTQENYKKVFAWSDVYAGADLFPQYAEERTQVDRNTYSARTAVPEWFKN